MVDEAKDDIDAVRDIVTAKPPPPAPPPVPRGNFEAEEAVSFVMESAEEVSDPRHEAEWERAAPAREAERRRQVAERAALIGGGARWSTPPHRNRADQAAAVAAGPAARSARTSARRR